MQLDYLRLATDFPFYLKTVEELTPGWTCPRLHLDMAEALVAGHEYVGLNGFRAAAKSYVVSVYCSWRIWLDPSIEILGLAGEEKLCRDLSRSVAERLYETPWLKQYSPLYSSTGLKRKNLSVNWQIPNYPRGQCGTWTGKTSLSNLRGPRSTLCIIDDALSSKYKHAEGWKEAANENLLEVPRVLHPAGYKFEQKGLAVPQYAKTRVVSMFTPSSPAPLNFYGKSNEPVLWNKVKTYRFPAVKCPEFDEDGELIGGESAWPEKYDFEYWQRECSGNKLAFNLDFLCDDSPMPDDLSLIHVNKLKVEDDSVKPKTLYCFLDPSGASGGDEYAYVIGGLIRDNGGTRLNIVELGGFNNMLPDEVTDRIFERLAEHDCKRIIVENNYAGLPVVQETAIRRKQRVVIDSFKTTVRHGSKEERLKGRLPKYCHASAVTFNQSVLEDQQNLEQFASVRAAPGLPKKRDRMDALCMICDHFQDSIRVSDKERGKKLNIYRWQG